MMTTLDNNRGVLTMASSLMKRKASSVDDYTVGEVIGSGSFGTVHRARVKVGNALNCRYAIIIIIWYS